MRGRALIAALLLGGGAARAQDAADGGATADAGAAESAEAPETAVPQPEGAVTAEAGAAPAAPKGALDRIFGGSWTSKGSLGLESRLFRPDDDARTVDRGLGIIGRLELRHTHGPIEEKVRGFGRMDHFDDRRSILVAEEAWLQARASWIRLRLGVDMVNWTATEAFHPADVINARNLDSDLENFEKVGEPMAELQVRPFEGTAVDLFFMPVFTVPRGISPASRLSFAPPGFELTGGRRLLDRHGTVTGDDFGPQGAVQIRQVIGPADVTVHAVYHMDRSQPLLLFDGATGQPYLLFQTVAQVGGTYQQAMGPFVAKLEAAARHFIPASAAADPMLAASVPDRDHVAVAAGLEYGRPHDGGSESTFILEGQLIVGPESAVLPLVSPFQRDALAGWRFAANDAAGREIFLGAIVDLETRDQILVNASYQQRLGETWTVAAGLRVYHAPAPAPSDAPGFSALRNADHLRLTLTRHF